MVVAPHAGAMPDCIPSVIRQQYHLGLDYRKTTMVTCTTQISTAPVQRLLETVSLYLHIPFCHTRCHYCDFNTYAGILPLREPYVRTLLTEIAMAGRLAELSGGT